MSSRTSSMNKAAASGDKQSVLSFLSTIPYDRRQCYLIRDMLLNAIAHGRIPTIKILVQDMRVRRCDIVTFSVANLLSKSSNWDVIFTVLDIVPEITSLLLHIYSSRGETSKMNIVRTHISSS